MLRNEFSVSTDVIIVTFYIFHEIHLSLLELIKPLKIIIIKILNIMYEITSDEFFSYGIRVRIKYYIHMPHM